MFTNIQDIHDSAIQYVPAESLTLPSNKYKRISIPYNPNRQCLGYLEGIAANYKEKTRNDRKYILDLWKNVESSEDFLEGMQNATIVGELDHPEERVDYSLTKGAIILTDFEIREDEGIVWARFAILDNEEGRTLLSYVKFGSILGVSSRGLGDEVVQNGETIIDPNTYEFFCFDVVAFPAVKSARQQFVDSGVINEEPITIHKHLESLLKTKITEINDQNELNNLKAVIESTNMKSKNALVESITHKLSSLSESTGNQSNSSEEIEEKNGKEETAKFKAEIKSLQDTLKERGKNSSYFRKKLQEMNAEQNKFKATISENLATISELNRDANIAKEKSNNLEAKLQEAKDSLSLAERENKRWKYRFENKLKDSISAKNDNKVLENKAAESTSEVNKLRQKLAESTKKIEFLNNSINMYKEKLSYQKRTELSRLEESKKSQLLKESEVKRLTEKLNNVVSENKSLNKNINELENLIKTNNAKISESLTKIKTLRKNEALIIDKYIRSRCSANNLNYEAVIGSLPKSCSIEDIDKRIEAMADRQMKFDMLPMSVAPISGRIVEHKVKSKPSEDEPSSFLVEALRNK